MPAHTGFLRNEIRFGIVAFVLLLVAGSIAFEIVGGSERTLFDSFLMKIVTVTTVGYHEAHQLDATGRGVAIAVLFFGVALYAARATAEASIEGKTVRSLRTSAAGALREVVQGGGR